MPELIDRLQTAVGHVYRIERELGGGGMSRVFLAEELALARRVVIKVLPPEMAAGVNKERFQRETQLAASLQDPLIVPILTAGTAEAAVNDGDASDILYYVMPFIDGQSLRERLDRDGQLPVPETVRMMRDVADALARAHESGVVHRDIKPDNVMLSGKHAMVTDFGVAKAVSASQEPGEGSLTQFGMALGTPMYMAPEQAAGDPDTDHRADLYALGIMLYECLSGRLPYDAATPQAMLAAHVSTPPIPITRFRASVPAALADIVMKCLEKTPADRWQTAAELSHALDLVAGSTSGLTPATITGSRVERFVTSRPSAVVGIAALGVGTIVMMIVYGSMHQFGLPDWTLVSGSVVTLACVLAVIGASVSARRGNGQFRWPRLRNGMIAVYGILAMSTAAHAFMRVTGIGPVGTLVASGVLNEQDRIVLARFDDFTGDTTLAETVTELLRIDLAQSPTVSLIEQPQIVSALRRMERDPSVVLDVELATEVAVREGAKAVVTGEVRSLGRDYVVTARVVAASSGETLAAARETARDGAVVDAVDRLSATLRERIGESLRTIRADAPLDQVTTRSTEALRSYARADRENNLANTDRAIAALEEAIATDSTFAMAYRKLAIILQNNNRDVERSHRLFTQAYEMRDRLTERERFLAEAAYFDYVEEDRDQSIAVYESLLDRYPNDRIALNNLAVDYRAEGRDADAATLLSRSIAQGGAPAVTFANAIPLMFTLGMRDSAEAHLAEFASAYPEHPSINRFRYQFATAGFDYETAERLIDPADLPSDPTIQAQVRFDLASVAMARGRLAHARDLLLEAYDIQAAADLGFIPQPRPLFAAEIEAQTALWFAGQPDRAVAVIDRGMRESNYDGLPADRRDDLQIAQIYARADRLDRAREMIQRAETEGLPRNATGANLDAAKAVVALVEQRHADAIDLLRSAIDQTAPCALCYRTELGEAYAGAGQPDSAIAVLERYVTTPDLNRTQYDGFNLWGALLLLGELYEQQGRPADAIRAYDQLLTNWKSADPILQERIETIQARLARLVADRG